MGKPRTAIQKQLCLPAIEVKQEKYCIINITVTNNCIIIKHVPVHDIVNNDLCVLY